MQSGRCLIQTAVLVNRSPILTRSPTPFEAAMYQYNANVGRALYNPFPYDFYFKTGSLLKRQFNKEERAREKLAFNWGKRSAPKKVSFSVTRTSKLPAKIKPVVFASTMPEDEMEVMSRITEADKTNDVKSLNRKGHRNLYLLIKRGSNHWRLPGAQGGLEHGELLHETAKRELHGECGTNMDAWMVGRHPIAFMNAPVSGEYDTAQYNKSKAHILAGQVDPTISDLRDFAWLTKEEIQTAVTSEYWNNIYDILSEH